MEDYNNQMGGGMSHDDGEGGDRKAMLDEARAIRLYLEHLNPTGPAEEPVDKRKGPRQVSPDVIERRMANLDIQIAEANTLKKLELIQKRKDYEIQLAEAKKAAASGMHLDPAAQKAALEQGFIDNVEAYGQRKGIGYATWREMNVPARVLKAAGLSR